jgi:diguanylate cyclase (GGDEF)-like protein
MFERLFIPKTKAGAIARIAAWSLVIALIGLAATNGMYRTFFPEITKSYWNDLRYFAFGLTLSIALPVLSMFFLIALRMNAMNTKLREIANRDGLTGLLNRAAFENLIRQRHIAPLQEAERGDALIIIDIDHFKSVNDRFGHAAGDHVLRTVSVCIAGNVFERDQVARIGGEEFAVLLVGSGASGAVRAAERIRSALEENKAHFEGETIRVTASIGGALYPHGTMFQSVYRGADNALYRAKRTGRNRCEFNGLPEKTVIPAFYPEDFDMPIAGSGASARPSIRSTAR